MQVLLTDPEPLMFHAEVVRRDGQPVGYIRAASYGHHARRGGRAGHGRHRAADQPLDATWIQAGDWSVEIAGSTVAAVTSLRPLYDPGNARIKM